MLVVVLDLVEELFAYGIGVAYSEGSNSGSSESKERGSLDVVMK